MRIYEIFSCLTSGKFLYFSDRNSFLLKKEIYYIYVIEGSNLLLENTNAVLTIWHLYKLFYIYKNFMNKVKIKKYNKEFVRIYEYN